MYEYEVIYQRHAVSEEDRVNQILFLFVKLSDKKVILNYFLKFRSGGMVNKNDIWLGLESALTT